ncbi:DUF6090 family protein [Algibacter sp.]|nr:DUF6090 family protein [Algibacter sp.]
MIKFFRKIRQQLLTDNKFSKYLIYAIGEIVLVVIGILIALQINNWNQNKLSNKKGIIALIGLKESIYQDSIMLLNLQEYKIDKVLKSIAILKSKPVYHDSLGKHFDKLRSRVIIRMDNSVFEELKSTGLNLFKNDSIKNEIINYYKFCYFTENDTHTEINRFNETIAEPFLFNNFERSDCVDDDCWIPKDYSALIINPDYNTLLLEKERTMEYGKMLVRLSKEYSSEMINFIETEIIKND